MSVLTYSAALIAGLAGSAHCFGMCGGMAGALGMRARATAATQSAAVLNATTYQVGRIGGYALAGALFGAAGATLQQAFDLSRIGAALRIASGVLLILIALRLLVRWNALSGVEKLGARFWSKLQPLAVRVARREGRSQSLLIGLLWGWLPCGLVYSMLMVAAASGSVVVGAGTMIAFGLGTLPSMLTSSLLAAQLQQLLAQRWPRIVGGVLLIIFGVWMMAMPLMHARPAAETPAHMHVH